MPSKPREAFAVSIKDLPAVIRATKEEPAEKKKSGGRLKQAVQLSILLLLLMLVLGLGLGGFLISSSMAVAFEQATPFLEAAKNHSSNILASADVSSSHLETMMSEAKTLTMASTPELLASLNRSVAMLARAQALLEHPTLTVSMG